MNADKEYLTVYADCSAEGEITPVSIEFENGRRLTITSVISSIPLSITKQGGEEIRYSVIMRGQHEYLFFEPGKKPKWYIFR